MQKIRPAPLPHIPTKYSLFQIEFKAFFIVFNKLNETEQDVFFGIYQVLSNKEQKNKKKNVLSQMKLIRIDLLQIVSGAKKRKKSNNMAQNNKHG